jgi:hypothetical protein
MGLWGFLKLVFSRTFARKEKLWDHALIQERKLGELETKIVLVEASNEALKRKNSELVQHVNKLTGYCKDIKAAALQEINTLRAQLKQPPLERWPSPKPTRPATPPAP